LNAINNIGEAVNERLKIIEAGDNPLETIIGNSKAVKAVLKRIKLIANTRVPVLITGESGTGKELAACALHKLSDRAKRPFITMNCAAIPANLIESELFGFEKGAFTGAVHTQIGKFEASHQGSIFIDEIGDMDFSVQAKLLRVLENYEISRLGSNQTRKIDTRFIFATNKNLLKAVEDGRFREDLYYRINVVNIELPPLRERKDDIPLLFKYYFNLLINEYKKKIDFIDPEVIQYITSYYWPGNIRQFRNIIENIIVLNENGKITFEDIPEEIRRGLDGYIRKDNLEKKSSVIFRTALPDLSNDKDHKFEIATLAEIEKNAIINTLKFTDFNRTKTAQILNVSLRTIQRKIKEYNIDNLFKNFTDADFDEQSE